MTTQSPFPSWRNQLADLALDLRWSWRAALSEPPEACTARALPREAAEESPLALPLIAWQR